MNVSMLQNHWGNIVTPSRVAEYHREGNYGAKKINVDAISKLGKKLFTATESPAQTLFQSKVPHRVRSHGGRYPWLLLS